MSRRVKGKDMSRRVKVNVPWFQRQHYEAIRRLVPDKPMPNTFEEWLETTTKYVSKKQASGVIVKTVLIDPQQFAAYRRTCEVNHVKATLGEFAIVAARKQHERGTYVPIRGVDRGGDQTPKLSPLTGAGAVSAQEPTGDVPWTSKSEFTAYKFQFLERLAADPDQHVALPVATILVSRHLNSETGLAWPRHEDLAKAIGASTKTVQRRINAMIEGGYLHIVEAPSPGRATRYKTILKP
jgi:hypothetical protein